jgi:O-antigen/teichoic acid export membrane protein
MTSFERFRRVLPTGEFVRGAMAIAAGTGAAQLISVASSPVLTRLYSPSDYGVMSVAVSILFVLISVTCLRYEFAIPLPRDDVDAANVLGLSLLTNLAMSAAVGAALLLFGDWLLSAFDAQVLSPYVVLFALAQFGGGVTSAFITWAIRAKNYPAIALNNLTSVIAQVGVQVGLGALNFGAPGLFLGAVAGNVVGSARLAQSAWRSQADALRRVSWRGITIAANRYRRFPIYSSPSALLAALGVRAPTLLIVAFYGTAVGGQYALAERVLFLPLTLIAGSVGQVFVAEAARLAHDRPQEVRRLFRQTTWSLIRVGIGPAIAVAVLSPFLAGLVFGPEWQQTGLYVAILTPMFFVQFVATATGNVLLVLERQPLHLLREILRFGLLGGSVVVASAAGLGPVGALIALSAAGSLNFVLYGLISWRAIVSYHPGPLPVLAVTAEE